MTFDVTDEHSGIFRIRHRTIYTARQYGDGPREKLAESCAHRWADHFTWVLGAETATLSVDVFRYPDDSTADYHRCTFRIGDELIEASKIEYEYSMDGAYQPLSLTLVTPQGELVVHRTTPPQALHTLYDSTWHGRQLMPIKHSSGISG